MHSYYHDTPQDRIVEALRKQAPTSITNSYRVLTLSDTAIIVAYAHRVLAHTASIYAGQ